MRNNWNKRKVKEAIKSIHEKGIKLTYSAIVKYDKQKLLNASDRYFGGWKQAVEASCLKPQYYHKYITKEDVINELIKRKNSNSNLKSIYIIREDAGLYAAAQTKFGSWINAIHAAGLSLDEIGYQHKTKWNKEKIVEEVKKMYNNGLKINSSSVQKIKYSLYKKAIELFRSWNATLIACGFDPMKIKRNGFWNKKKVIDEIKKRKKSNQSLRLRAIEKTYLYEQAKKYFGTWKNALKEAGIKQKTRYLGESIIYRLMKEMLIGTEWERNYKLPPLENEKGRLLLDLFNNELKIGIEFQGPTHFYPIFGEKELEKQVERDKRKIEICRKNNIKLIIINYDQLNSKTISQKLSDLNIKHAFSEKFNYLCKFYTEKYAAKINHYY